MGNICFGRHSTTILKPFDEKKSKTYRGSAPDPAAQYLTNGPKPPVIITTDPVVVTEVTSHRNKESQPLLPAQPSPAAPSPAPAHVPAQAPAQVPTHVPTHEPAHVPAQAPASVPAQAPAQVQLPAQEPHVPQVPPHVPAPAAVPPLSPEALEVVKRRKIQIFEQMFSSDPIRGHLAKDRLRSLLEQMRIMDPAVHEFLWRQYDTDYNGKIDFQEFCSMMFDVMDIKKSFEAADDNGDKALSVDEMYTVLSHLDISFERVTIDAIMDLFDKNHDGSVDFGEFFPLSIFLHGLISKYNEFLDTRNAGEAHWLRTLLGGDKEKEAEVAKELNNLVNDGAIPSIDAFARVIIAAAKETDFKGKVKAPQITNVRVKELPSEKVKKAIPRVHAGKGHVPIEFEGIFEDPEFPPDDDILPPALADKVTWRRPNEINPERQELFVDGVEEGDVIQGSLGDCWFLGALAVVAASSHNYVKDIFVEADPERGYYVCKFFKNGEWVYVHIDDRLPCRVTRAGGVYLCFASCRDEGEFWVPLVEKGNLSSILCPPLFFFCLE